MKQNIYDIPGFFKGYKKARDSQSSLNEMLEQLAIISLIPDIKGKNVLDLGCGTGETCRRLKALGAKSVIGVDISANMLEIAQKEEMDGISYLNQAMEDAEFSSDRFDLVISSLAFHYIENLDVMFQKIYQYLQPKGALIFSIEHPILTCTQGIHHGWIKDESGEKKCWPVDCYSDEGKRESHWFVEGVIKYHRTMSTIMNGLIKAGFNIQVVQEPRPSAEDESNWPQLKDSSRRPPFLIVKATK